jgi:hypothetical protein
VSGFSAEWLALREPADVSARSLDLTRAVARVLPSEDLCAVDLAAGTGSNVRYLAEHLAPRQEWLVVDHDPMLLAEAPAAILQWDATRECRTAILRAELASATGSSGGFAVFDDERIFAGRQLVTASALLDLVSEPWLHALAARCRLEGAAVLLTLSYDGTIRCSPEAPEDDRIRDLVNRHQRTDKGFGPALGPQAAAEADRIFTELGYQVRRASSPWRLPPEMRELQRWLIDGWARAAVEMLEIDRGSSGWVSEWRAVRVAHVDAGRSDLVVGHEDIAAWPKAERAKEDENAAGCVKTG